MSDLYDDSRTPSTIDHQPLSEAVSAPIPDPRPDAKPAQEPQPVGPEGVEAKEAREDPPADPAVARFKSCRWHEKQDDGALYCAHRDVLPFAGKNGFKAEAWCPECSFFKVKRTVKRRPVEDYDRY